MMNKRASRRELLVLGGISATAAVAWAFSAPANSARTYEVQFTPAEWRKRLGPDRFYVLREAGTERAFTSPLNNEHRRGIFTCGGCALPLFSSATKFDSGTGWPSFFRPLPHAVVTRPDYGIGVRRTEVLCRRCGGHLGHVFPDGPRPTGLRYCMNGLALNFVPA